MKKNRPLFSILILVISLMISTGNISAQVDIVSTADTTAFLDVQYQYDVNASTPPAKMPLTYSLVEKPDGMIINPTTGKITWTPGSMGDGGKVVVKATNNVSEYETQEFFVYVTDAISCEDLDAYWKMDETSGSDYEDYVGTNDAEAVATAPVPAQGIVDISQSFNPVNLKGLSVPRDTVFNWASNEDFSVELWFKNHVNHIDSNAVLIGRNEGAGTVVHWWIGLMPDGTVNGIIRTYGTVQCKSSLSTTVNDTSWHQVVLVRNASENTVLLYLDGEYEDAEAWDGTGPGLVSDVPLDIGWLRRGPFDEKNYPFNGRIDEVRLYSKALSPGKVDSNYYDTGTKHKPACKPGNYAPLYKSTPVVTATEEQPYSYTLAANDIDIGDVVIYEPVKKPSWLTYSAGSLTFSGTPTNNDVGSDSVVTRITDGKVYVYQRFLLQVINTNDPPSITSSPVLTVLEETPYSYDVEATDIDAGDNKTFTAPVKPAWLSIDPSSGLLSGTPPLNDTAQYNITVRVTDDSAAYDEQAFVLDVRNVNDAPVITGQEPLDVDEDNPIVIHLSNLTYTDVDNGPGDMLLTVDDSTNYTHVGNTVTPAENYHGTIYVPIEVSDGQYSDRYILTITVNSVNDVPEITTTPDYVAYENQQYIYLFAADDDDVGDVLTYASIKKPDWLSFNPSNQVLSGKPDFFDIGTDSVVLRVSDGTANVYLRYELEVMLTNNIPHITSIPVTAVNEDAPYSYTVTYTDADPADFVTLSYVIKPDWLTLDGDVLSGTPTNDLLGTEPFVNYTVRLRVTDGKQDSTQTFSITVTNINDAPEITGQPDTLLAYAGTSLVIGVGDLTVEDVDNIPGDLSVIIMPGSHYTPSGDTAKISPSAPGIIYINVRVSDGELQSSTYNAYARIYGGTGIYEPQHTNTLVTKIYPVPANEYVMFEINPGSTNMNFELVTMQGQTIYKDIISSGRDLFRLDVNDIPSGLYIYKFLNNKNYQTGIVTIRK